MQLQFTREELGLVAQVLEQQAASGTDCLKDAGYRLLDHVIAHDLCFACDELEDLREILELYHGAAHQLPPDRELLLQRIQDKVTEACAMV